ncbi:MAG: hypothetical protein IJX76_09075 [Clostridia bacterium]|nr:hypothetical protein [Clostridia bacterium]
MKRFFPSLRYILLILITLLGIWWLPAQFEGSAAPATIEYYGRYALSKEPNSKALLYAYDQIVAGVEVSAEEITVYNGKNPLSDDELLTVMEAYIRDHTDHFWVNGGYNYIYNSLTVLSIRLNYTISGSQLAEARRDFEAVVQDYLSCLNDSMTDFEKEVALHDRLAQSVTYTSTANAHNSYGALVEGEAVCEGYAEAFQYLLQRAGIQSFVVTGVYENPDTGRRVNHAWNLVRIGGKYYHTDVTWDDQEKHTYHAYFNLTDTAMQEDHIFDTPAYELPVCDSMDAQYFNIMSGLQGKTYSTVKIADRLRVGNLQTSVYITENMDDFVKWLNQHISDIAKSLGLLSGYSYRYSHLGREFMLEVTVTCTHQKLTAVTAQDATCETEGNTAYYKCSCGKWYADASAKTEITDRDSVVIPVKGHDYTAKRMESAYLKHEGTTCLAYNEYYYACSRCAASAKDSSIAVKSYTGTVTGSHSFTQKVADEAHLVSGSGANCKGVKQYYYDCAYCDRIGTATWNSTTYGSHLFIAQWSSDPNEHWHVCTVCGDRSGVASHADGDQDGECDDCAYVMSVLPPIIVPSTTAPTTTKPAATEPATTESVVTKPATTEPVTTVPAVTKPTTTVPVTATPVTTIPETSRTPVGSTPSDAPAESNAGTDDSGSDSVPVIVFGTVGVLVGASITVSVILIRKRKFRVS